MIKIQIKLDETSFRVLRSLAARECRDPRLQAALIIRQNLEQRGLLATTPTLNDIPDIFIGSVLCEPSDINGGQKNAH